MIKNENSVLTNPIKKLALGTVQFGMAYGISDGNGQVEEEEVSKILTTAEQSGILTLDTAIAYGQSEKVLGTVGVEKFELITKLPGLRPDCDNVKNWVNSEFQNALGRLNVDHVNAILLHKPSDLLSPKGHELYKALLELKETGLVEQIGISIYVPDELDALCPHFDFDIIQSPLNIFDRRLIETGWATQLHKLGIEVHTRSAFLQGLLLMNSSSRPQKFNRWQSIWEKWEEMLIEKRLTPLQACLQYVLSIDEVDRVIVGVNNLEQLQEIISACHETATDLSKWSVKCDDKLVNPSYWNEL